MRPRSDSLLDTITALATPLGRSALAVVRLSGPQTLELLRRIVPGLPRLMRPREARLLALCGSDGKLLDRGIVTYFPGPASYTGEDMAEISVHGSPVLARGVLSALTEAGARVARPGEFTERAFLLGKMDLIEAEAVRELIEARTEAAARFSARRLEGGLSDRLSRVREDLLGVAAQLTAAIDFSEDVGEKLPDALLSRLGATAAELSVLAGTHAAGRLLESGCRVAILGLPNAGKSTLFNALVGTARAIVTEIPGTTRDTLDATIDIGGIPVELVDTAGLRETDEVVERIGVERARAEGERADAVIYVYDVTRGWQPEDETAVAAWNGKPRLVVANKMDRPAASSGEAPPAAEAEPLCGLGPDAGARLQALLAQRIAAGVSTESASDVLSSARQKDLVMRARDAAAQAREALSGGVSPEYAATHVHAALDALADLCGETTSEDVLRRIFDSFCIGK
ncbi:MAG: tRNA uridine-5-carboxymethylaminomethyl(34) synthesis GTPase MnmE [Thermoanaerobaculia bacterium]